MRRTLSLLVFVLLVPLALWAAVTVPRSFTIAAAAATAPVGTVAQREAIARARMDAAHPRWKELSAAARLDRLALFGKRVLRALGGATDAPATPAAFTGNLTVVQGGSGQAIVLQRQADCSLRLLAGSYGVSFTNPTITVQSTTPNFQRSLHDAAGLTTVAGTWPRGCADPTLGIGSRRGLYLGRAAQNGLLFAAAGYDHVADANALYHGVVDAATQQVRSFVADTSAPELDGIAAGDLNGDGIADVVGLDLRSGSVAVWLTRADGSLSGPVRYAAAGVRTRAAALADFDGDGKVDLLVVADTADNPIHEVAAFLRGKGDGSFETARTLTLTSPSPEFSAQIVNVVAADLRGSGRPDVVASNGTVLLNDGHGNFTQASAYAFPILAATSNWAPTLVAADFDEDGKVDVAVGTGTSVRFFMGRGDGSFAPGRAYASNDSVGYLAASDLDGDGHLDIWVGLGNGGYLGGDQFQVNQGYALMGRGDGSFSGAPKLPFVYTGRNLADLDGDGKLDAIGVNSDVSFTSWLGDGGGGFAAGTTLAVRSVVVGTETFPVSEIESFAIADVNGDGKPDLVFHGRDFVARSSTSDFYFQGFLVALGDGHGGFAAPPYLRAPSFVPAGDFDYTLELTNVRLADVDGDGKADLVYGFVSTAYNSSVRSTGVAVQLGNGDGSFRAPQTIVAGSHVSTDGGFDRDMQVQEIVDLNRDGKPDLVLLTQQSATLDPNLGGFPRAVQVALGRGDGSFQAPATVDTVETLAGYYTQPLSVGDMNGDGIADIVVAGSSSDDKAQIAIALGNGDGTFRAASRTTLALDANGFADAQPALGDFDGDGKVDVLVSRIFDPSGIVLGRGDGTLAPGGAPNAPGFNRTIALPIGGAARVLSFTDDGRADAIVGDTLLLSTAATATSGDAGFSLGAAQSAGSVRAGQSLETTLTLGPGAGYSGTVTFACSGLPQVAACSFSPDRLSLSTSPATTTLRIDTTAAAALAAATRSDPGGGAAGPAAMAAIAALLIAWTAALASRRPLRRRAPLAAALLAGAGVVAACGGSDFENGSAGTSGATPAGDYSVVVTASDGRASRSVSIALEVQ